MPSAVALSPAKRALVRVCFVTLGCAKNEVDSADMARRLEGAGYAIVFEPSAADLVIVNTCSFIQSAVEEGIDAILEVADEGTAKGVPVIVSGCMPSRYGHELEQELAEISAFVPCAEEDRIVEIVDACASRLRSVRDEGDAHARGSRDEEVFACEDEREAVSEGDARPAFAYVKISDGCDRWCSYCTIPLIRGRYHSFSYDQIRSDVARAVSEGAREIVLIGQDTGLWGSDFAEPSSLAELLSGLAAAFPQTWFRAMYTQPENVTDELLAVMASCENVCPYLDIPLQHEDATLLKAMNRTGSKEEFLGLVARARERVPGIALRTTLIVGFPGETEDMFEELVDFVEEAAFDYVGVFAYSREEGTRAFHLPDQVDEAEKAFRAERLRTIADAVSAGVIAARIGRVFPLVVEGREEDGQAYGRAIVQAPEVDGVTYVDGGDPGCVYDVLVEDALMYDMEGSRA